VSLLHLIFQKEMMLPASKGCKKWNISLQCYESCQDVAISCTELFQIHNKTIFNARHNGLWAFTTADLLRTNHIYLVSHNTGTLYFSCSPSDTCYMFQPAPRPSPGMSIQEPTRVLPLYGSCIDITSDGLSTGRNM